MKKKRIACDAKQYILLKELNVIADEMGQSLRMADPSHVAKGNPTMHMLLALEDFYGWARRYCEAGYGNR